MQAEATTAGKAPEPGSAEAVGSLAAQTTPVAAKEATRAAVTQTATTGPAAASPAHWWDAQAGRRQPTEGNQVVPWQRGCGRSSIGQSRRPGAGW
jgi:hypothetical protein